MGRVLRVGLLALVSGCVTVQSTEPQQLSSEGVFFVQATVDHGDISYDGINSQELFDMRTTSWGHGSNKRKATARRDDNVHSAVVQGEVLELVGVGGDRSGVDFDVVGPGFMHIDAVTTSGQVSLFNVEGSHIVTASSVFARGVVGDADLYADGSGIDAEIFPYADGVVQVDSINGDVDLYLPFGPEYDLTVVTDPDYEVVIEDLGFDTLILQPGLALGQAGRRLVRVDVVVTGGSVRVFGAR